MVVDGVPMRGSNATLYDMNSDLSGWLGLPGSRMRTVKSNTIIMKDGQPIHSLGSPGNIYFTVPQMISNVLDYHYDPYTAAVLPRMLPMRDDFIIEIETRIPERVVRDLARIGGKLSPLPPYDSGHGVISAGVARSGHGTARARALTLDVQARPAAYDAVCLSTPLIRRVISCCRVVAFFSRPPS